MRVIDASQCRLGFAPATSPTPSDVSPPEKCPRTSKDSEGSKAVPKFDYSELTSTECVSPIILPPPNVSQPAAPPVHELHPPLSGTLACSGHEESCLTSATGEATPQKMHVAQLSKPAQLELEGITNKPNTSGRTPDHFSARN